MDQKFIKKYLQRDTLPHEQRSLVNLQSLSTENTDGFQDLPFRKITKGRKREKPWKDYQKKKQRDKLKF